MNENGVVEMITFFPTPYPDETLYSIIARYHIYSGNMTYKHTITNLLGIRVWRAKWDMPSHIGVLQSRIPDIGLTTDDLIYNHTLYPYYSAFLPEEKRFIIKNQMIDSNGSGITRSLSTGSSDIKIEKLLCHCKHCMEEDIENFGESYWRRTHQIPGVFVCPDHQVPLMTSSKQLIEFNKHHFSTPNEDFFLNANTLHFEKEVLNQLLTYAIEVKWLLNEREVDLEFKTLENYKALLKTNGYIRSRYVNLRKWRKDFENFYSKELLEWLSSASRGSENGWFDSIFRQGNSSIHPLRHILVIILLSGSLREFFSGNIQAKKDLKTPPPFLEAKKDLKTPPPFGNGPWMCLNPAHSDYGKDVIKEIEIVECGSTNQPIGRFKCKCGFSYSRKGPDLVESDKFKIGKITDFGPVWKEKLKQLIKQGNTMKDIAKKLNVSPNTIKRYATLMNLSYSWKGEQLEQTLISQKFSDKISKKGGTNENIKHRRAEWLNLLESVENERYRDTVSQWLRKYDNEWLKKNKVKKGKRSIKKINWQKRDEQLLVEVKTIVENWDLYEHHRPKRITRNSISNKLKSPSVVKAMRGSIPLTQKYIDSICETLEQYRLRKLKWAVKEMRAYNDPLTKTKLLKKAGISGTSILPSHKRFINEVIIGIW